MKSLLWCVLLLASAAPAVQGGLLDVFDEPAKVLGLKLNAEIAREAMQGQKHGGIDIKPPKRR